MCKKKNYCGSRIDECLKDEIEYINRIEGLKTVSSCCGHGKYDKTIIVTNLQGKYFDYCSGIELKEPKLNRFYKKDKQGYYYLNPDLIIGRGI